MQAHYAHSINNWLSSPLCEGFMLKEIKFKKRAIQRRNSWWGLNTSSWACNWSSILHFNESQWRNYYNLYQNIIYLFVFEIILSFLMLFRVLILNKSHEQAYMSFIILLRRISPISLALNIDLMNFLLNMNSSNIYTRSIGHSLFNTSLGEIFWIEYGLSIQQLQISLDILMTRFLDRQ